VIRLANNDERVVKGPLQITAVPGGLLINAVRVRTAGVRIRARAGDLTIKILSASVQGREHRTDRKPVIGKRSVTNDVIPPPSGTMPASEPASLVVGGTVVVVHRGGGLAVINELDLEEYVKGVVPSEMSAAWHPEALKVQAVAARTYALYQKMLNDDRDYDVVAGVQDQVYRGRYGVDQRVQHAVESTRGLVMTYRNAPILAAFSSTAAGPTEDAMIVWAKDLPYLKGVDCPFDQNSPYYQWRAQFTITALEQSLRKNGVAVGTIATLTPYSYSRAGRVDKVRILHSNGELILRGQDLRKAVGYSVIPSTQFQIDEIGRDVVLSGRGSGHAVGLCQWGAKELAEQGYAYAAILHYYFPETSLKPIRGLERPSVPSS
jgi:stage II sporulation protein D